MPNLLKHSELVNDPNFQARVHAASVQAAIDISGEGPTTDPKSNARQMYAGAVLNNSMTMTPLVWAVAANITILAAYAAGTEIPDGDIEFALANVWDDVSGAARINTTPVPAP